VLISAIETIPVGLPFREPYVTATGSLDQREMLIVRITGPGGEIGNGDAVPLSLRGGPDLASVRADIDGACAAILTGAEIEPHPESVLAATAPPIAACAAAGAGPQAIAGVEMALLDLIGRLRGEPLWRLLGAAMAVPVECNATLGADDPVHAAATASTYARSGFTTLKLKVGSGEDVERLEAVRATVGGTVALRVDANGAWSVAEARECLNALREVGLELAEQPCATVGELAELRPLVDVPIVADESADTSDAAAECMAAGACDAVTVKLAKVGGIGAALELAESAPAYLSSALDSPLGILAAAHTTQVLPARGFATELAHGLATSSLFADNVADDGHLHGPCIELGDDPGLGIELDEASLERLRIQ
jgi:L-alanine-DL-glutamate epimerase-like enolase superfamily enzyme